MTEHLDSAGRVASGNQRLDAILGGGFPAHGINLVVGPPGSGKTVLAQQYVFHNATPQRPAIYLTTVSEPLEKVLRYGQTMAFFDASAVGRAVLYEDVGGPLGTKGLTAVLERVDTLLKEHRPAIIVIDSFKALTPYATDQGGFRRFLHSLAGQLSAFPVTSLWLGEYDSAELSTAPEFAVADAIVSLSSDRVGHRELRVLQVLKLRGSGSLSGRHAYRLSEAGLDVFPRLADPIDASAYSMATERVSSGIPALDTMLEDGYWPGAATLVAGPTGSGKTLMGLHFIVSGARRGEPGIVATLQENLTQLQRIAQGFGWSLAEPGIELLPRSPVDLYIDQWVYELLATIERTSARRVLIDSLGDLAFAAGDETRYREYLYSLVQRCSRLGVSMLMTFELPELFQLTRLSELGVSHVSDNVVVLQYLRHQSEVKRTLTVLKTRASLHQPQVREFTITPEGITLENEFPTDPEPSAQPSPTKAKAVEQPSN
ncbi:MAG TPA: ATPase domain-containing protein [Actinomycetes bacterium]|nr:ATPase domain-containing protein [Actinomycetes bacterium]